MTAPRKLGRTLDGLNVMAVQKVPTGTRTATQAGGIVDWPATEPCSMTFVKRAAATRLLVNLEISYFTAAISQFNFGVLVDASATKIIGAYSNQALEHDERGAWLEFTGLSAGSHTIKVQVEIIGGGDVQCDTNDTVSLMVMELA